MQNAKILLDQPSDNPALGFDEYARALREIIERSDAQFAIGIFGGWGSGKTTLMKAIEGGLDQSTHIPVRFSAWRYEKEQHLIIPLLDTLREAFAAWSDRHEPEEGERPAMKTASTIGRVMKSLLHGLSLKIGVPEAIELSFEASKALTHAETLKKAEEDAKVSRSFYHGSFRALDSAFEQFIRDDPNRRIVVFVDDLDRCLPEGALEVMESMKLFFDLPGFVFVVGLDRQVVETAIDSKYARDRATASEADQKLFKIRGSEYIKKIFQVPFSLFPVSVGELDPFLQSICASAKLEQEQIDDLATVVRPHLDYLVTEAGVNPREVKRYINGYTLLRKVKPLPKPEIMLALQTIEFRPDWTIVRESLFAYRRIFTEALERQVMQNDARALENLDPRLRAIPGDFLKYVGPNGAAHALLFEDEIDKYIYAGEAARSQTGSTHMADLIRDTASLRQVLRDLADNPTDAGPLDALRTGAMGLQSRLETSDSAPDPYIQTVVRTLGELDRVLNLLPADDPQPILARLDTLLSEALTALVRASR